MEKITKAITLKTTDIKDNDKLLTIYSLDDGKLTVTARGIRKATAKLKFVKEPFCFGEFELIGKGDRYVLKTCKQLESFSSITADLVSYYCGCVAVDVIISYEHEGANSQLFVLLLRTISTMTSVSGSALTTLVKYLLCYLHIAGYKLTFDKCSCCGSSEITHFSSDNGVVCSSCYGEELLSEQCLQAFKLIDSTKTKDIATFTVSDIVNKQLLVFLDSFYKA